MKGFHTPQRRSWFSSIVLPLILTSSMPLHEAIYGTLTHRFFYASPFNFYYCHTISLLRNFEKTKTEVSNMVFRNAQKSLLRPHLWDVAIFNLYYHSANRCQFHILADSTRHPTFAPGSPYSSPTEKLALFYLSNTFHCVVSSSGIKRFLDAITGPIYSAHFETPLSKPVLSELMHVNTSSSSEMEVIKDTDIPKR